MDDLDKTQRFALIIIMALTCLLYAPILRHGYVDYDDYQLFVENFAVQAFNLKEIFGAFAGGTYVPLTLLSAAIEYRWLGPDPFYFHLFDLLLHALSTGLVCLMFLRLGLRSRYAVLLALIFGLHPLRVESVAWAAARKDTLSGLLVLLAMLLYQSSTLSPARRQAACYYGAAVAAFVLACLAKPVAVIVPMLWLAWDFYQKKLSPAAALLPKLPCLLVSVVVGLVNAKAQLTADILAARPDYLSSVFSVMPLSLSFYLSKFVLPLDLSILYPASYFDGKSWYYLVALAVLALAAAGLFPAATRRQSLFCWAWFAGPLALMLKVIPFGSEESWVHDRFLYLPSIGLTGACLLGCQALATRWAIGEGTRKVALFSCAAWLVWLLTLTHTQIKVWQSTETLWQQVQRTYPLLPHSYRALATEALMRGHFKAAIPLLVQAHELESHPVKRLEILSSLAVAWSQAGDLEKALSLFEKVMADHPSFDTKVNYGVTLFLAKRFSEARLLLEQTMNEEPHDPRPPYNLALIALEEGNVGKAQQLLKTTLAKDPNFVPALTKLRTITPPP